MALDRHADQGAEARELDDRVELTRHLRSRHAEDDTAEIEVFPPGEVGVKAGADLDERDASSADLDGPAGWASWSRRSVSASCSCPRHYGR